MAHLALVDSDDPLEAGLEIFAQPPGKRLQSLTLLSGGEQALTAVALIFALFLTNPRQSAFWTKWTRRLMMRISSGSATCLRR
jgi:chromosome segregation ATPase